MKLSIKYLALAVFFTLSFNVICKTNSGSIKRIHQSNSIKNKLSKNISANNIPFHNKQTFAKSNIKSKNNLSSLRKGNNITANNVLDSAVYTQDNLKRKYEVNFNSSNLISGELVHYWNEMTNLWITDTRNLREYNNENQQTEELVEYFNPTTSEWVSDWKYTAEYTNGGITEIWLFDRWNEDSNAWDSWWRQTINNSTNNVTYFEETWDDTLNVWVNDYMSEINYDNSGNELNYFGESWDTGLASWINSWKDTTFYDDQNRLVGYKSYYFENGQWYAWDNEIYSYNDAGLLFEVLVLDLDLDTATWLDYQKISFDYDDKGQLISKFIDNLDINFYNYRTSFQYDANGNMLYAMNEEVDPDNGSATLVTDNIDFSDIFADYSFYASELNAFYSVPTDINDLIEFLPSQLTLEQNYPNPFNPTTKINYTIPNNQLANSNNTVLKIFDILGNEVITLVNEHQPAGSYSVDFNSNGLSSGIYFYQLIAGNINITKNMMLLK